MITTKKFHSLFFNMTRNIEIKFKTIFMSTYAYNMYSHDIKYNVEFFIIIRHRNFP